VVPTPFLVEAIRCSVVVFLYPDEVIRHETVTMHDEIEGTLGFADAALAHDEDPHPQDIE
jgi:hypothetical protein